MLRSLLWTLVFTLSLTRVAPLTAGDDASRSVRVRVQPRPGAPLEEVDMGIYTSPTDLRTVSVDEATLDGNELVLGIVTDGRAMAYPIRYLAMYEIVNDRVGAADVAPTW